MTVIGQTLSAQLVAIGFSIWQSLIAKLLIFPL